MIVQVFSFQNMEDARVRSVLFRSEAAYHIIPSHIRLIHPRARTSAHEKSTSRVCIGESVAEILSSIMTSIAGLNMFLIVSSGLLMSLDFFSLRPKLTGYCHILPLYMLAPPKCGLEDCRHQLKLLKVDMFA
jgi:hypothetical protein